jgi:hypothetical protein
VSKSRGKQRAILLSDSDDQDLESPEKLSASRATSPSLSEISIPELPPTDSEYASSSTESMVEPSEGSELDHGLQVNSRLTEPKSPRSVQYQEANESSTSRRSKRVHIERHISVEGNEACSEDGCEDPIDARPMVSCAGPGCGLMVSDPCLISRAP